MRKLRLGIAVLVPTLLAFPLGVTSADARLPSVVPKRGGTYEGATSQEQTVRFKVSRSGRSLEGEIGEVYDCGDFGFIDRDAIGGPLPTTGRISGSLRAEGDMPDDPDIGAGDITGLWRATISARFSKPAKRTRIAQVLSGTWRAHITVLDGTKNHIAECDTGTVKFTARLVR
jgi:hypothetical protein